MTGPAPKPAAARVGTIVWAIVVMTLLGYTATGVVTLFGSKFGALFGMSAEPLADQSAVNPKRRTSSDFATQRATDAGER